MDFIVFQIINSYVPRYKLIYTNILFKSILAESLDPAIICEIAFNMKYEIVDLSEGKFQYTKLQVT